MPSRKSIAGIAKLFAKAGYTAEQSRLRKAEKESRDKDAGRGRILGTDTLRDRDLKTAGRLTTTLGGLPRQIQREDLEAFAAYTRELGERYKAGITARQIVDESLEADRQRAAEQITTAVVVRAQAGALQFVTNAGPDSKRPRHLVNVAFPSFDAAAASPVDARKLGRKMLDGALRFECDCERFRYHYRFLATRGNWVLGRPEPGYTRFTNPRLRGIACKHALRVMVAVQKDATVLTHAAKMIAAAQANDRSASTVKSADARAAAQRQLTAAAAGRVGARIETTAQRKQRLGGTTSAKRRVVAAAQASAKKRSAALKTASPAELIARLTHAGALPPEQLAQLREFLARQARGVV